ncbi:MAG: sulfatase-like hydrolase/transferase [Bacteroidales bacterium]
MNIPETYNLISKKRSKRERFISFLNGWLPLELICILIGTTLPAAGKVKEKPNILFIISDDLTVTALSSYENKMYQTPHIDKLASEGMRYTRAYSQYPVCGPSRASLMFGYYPTATETYGYVSGRENVGEERDSWSQLFKKNGYYTARVSKIYHMGVPIHIEEGSNGSDDEASWTERFNSPGPEWKAEGEAELVQNNPYGLKPRQGGNVMTVVKASGWDLVHSDGKTYLLRTKKWAYIQYDEDAGSGIELYDMEYDPGQYNNLANNPLYVKIVDRFRNRLQEKLKEVRDNDLGIDYTEQAI